MDPEENSATNDSLNDVAGAVVNETEPSPPGYHNSTYVTREIEHHAIADRTGELIDKVHAVIGDKQYARAVAVYEPDTGTEGVAILKPDGQINPLPSHFFDEYRTGPKRRQGSATFSRIDSFIDHVNRFSSVNSALFARDNMTDPKLTAVLDYHPIVNTPISDGVVEHNDRAATGFGQHRSQFSFPLSEEWKAWVKLNKKPMDHTDFAEFLEDRFVDIQYVTAETPIHEDIDKLIGAYGRAALGTPNSIFQLTEGLTISENVVVGGHTKLQNGATQIMLRTEQNGAVNGRGEAVDVPAAFLIQIPIFAHAEPQQIAVRLRTRTSGGLTFSYELWGVERVFERAFTETCQKAADETGLPLFYGNPE